MTISLTILDAHSNGSLARLAFNMFYPMLLINEQLFDPH